MDREKKIIKTSQLGIGVNILLVIFKMAVGFIANSIAIILDGVNNLTDVISSTVTIVGTKLASKAPDKEHPYGHGRIEYIAALIVSEIVLLAGVVAIKESIDKIINPNETNYTIISLVIIFVGVITKLFLGKYVTKAGKKLNSQSLIASGQDALMDSILSFTTLVSAILNYILGLNLEGYLGILISIFIIKTAVGMLKETTSIMIGGRNEKELADKIEKKVCSYKEVQGAYDLVLHNYGPSKIIGTVHIQVRDDMRADELHILTRQISMDIFNEYGIVLTVGIYAANDKDNYKDIKDYLMELISRYNQIKQIHGFYVDEENSSIYFDLIIDFDCKNQEEIKKEIIEKLEAKYPQYKFNVILDGDFND
ncbi:MAG: cation transporter [Clostridia bacterium]|nr:cation transporter [Clostridia bacterium]